MSLEKIYTNDNCVGCNLCISNCPCGEANVAVVENGKLKIHIDSDKCIVCGECIRKCTHGAREFMDDTERFFYDLRGGKQISVIAAPAIRTNFENYESLLGFLRSMGAHTLFDTSFGADICTWAYLRYMTRNNQTGLISQPCPAIVNYIERYTPELLGKLAPIHSPAMCTAVYMNQYKKIPGSYAFLSPCIAKQDEFFDGNTGGLVQYNITFKKLADYLDQHGINYKSFPADNFDNERHGLGAVFPMPGGLKENVELYVNDVWIHQVEGQPHACSFLNEYSGRSRGSSSPFLVDILNCQHGCNMGTGALRHEDESLAVGEALHTAKTQAKSAVKKNRIPGPAFSKFDKELTLSDFYRSYTDKRVKEIKVTPRDIENAFNSLYKTTEKQRIVDCRSCGFASCNKMAEAVAKGINHVENCAEYSKSVRDEQNRQMDILSAERDLQAEKLRGGVESILLSIVESTKQTDTTKTDVQGINRRIEHMGDISSRLSSHVDSLRKDIAKYSQMSDEIVNISQQTNILALNASVEAARAGQNGRGFAIIAGQIRELSNQSNQSATGAVEINEIIAPLLTMLHNLSDEILHESHTIFSNAENILSSINELSRIQQSIAESAAKISVNETV